MPQCVTFDYFSTDCKMLLCRGPQTKQGAPHFKRVLGPQKVYFNHCRCFFMSVTSFFLNFDPQETQKCSLFQLMLSKPSINGIFVTETVGLISSVIFSVKFLFPNTVPH